MPERFFTADWHLFHKNIDFYCNRKQGNLNKMHDTLLRNHNSVVKPEDEVWVIGDITMMSPEYAQRAKKLIERFNGTKHLVLGNHDEWKPHTYEANGFWTVHTAMWFPYKDFTFYLAHDPAKYTIIHNDPEAIMLCGHVHQLFQHLLPSRRIINVGVDAWDLSPVSFTQILELLREHGIL